MNKRKNIDHFFQEKFKDFEVKPSEEVWKNIESKLTEKKKNRKVIPFWIKLSGIAAALLIGFFTADTLLNSKKDNDQNMVIKETESLKNKELNSIKNKEVITSSDVSAPVIQKNSGSGVSEKNAQNKNWNAANTTISQSKISKTNNQRNSLSTSITRRTIDSERKSGSESIVNTRLNKGNQAIVYHNTKKSKRENTGKRVLKSKKQESLIAENSGSAVKNQLEFEQNESTTSELLKQSLTNNKLSGNSINEKLSDNKIQNGIVNGIDSDKKSDSAAIASIVPNALEELAKEKELKMATTSPQLNKWQVTSTVAPIYFSSASNGSPLDSQFANNSKNYKTSLGYGLGVQYALNPKFSLRTGVNAVALEYSTNDVIFYQTKNATSIKHLTYNLPGSLIQIESKNASQEISVNNISVSKFDGNLNQKTGYIEIPFEFSYKIINRKFGMEVVGGVSTLFLNENKITLVSSGLEMNIGEANNLNSMHFSTNVGLGFKYNVLKSFQVNFEPMFKYQINTFSNDAGNFKPYFFGLYTGMSYRF